MKNLYNTGLTDQKTILYKYWKNITFIYIELSLYKKNTWNNQKRIQSIVICMIGTQFFSFSMK